MRYEGNEKEDLRRERAEEIWTDPLELEDSIQQPNDIPVHHHHYWRFAGIIIAFILSYSVFSVLFAVKKDSATVSVPISRQMESSGNSIGEEINFHYLNGSTISYLINYYLPEDEPSGSTFVEGFVTLLENGSTLQSELNYMADLLSYLKETLPPSELEDFIFLEDSLPEMSSDYMSSISPEEGAEYLALGYKNATLYDLLTLYNSSFSKIPDDIYEDFTIRYRNSIAGNLSPEELYKLNEDFLNYILELINKNDYPQTTITL